MFTTNKKNAGIHAQGFFWLLIVSSNPSTVDAATVWLLSMTFNPVALLFLSQTPHLLDFLENGLNTSI